MTVEPERPSDATRAAEDADAKRSPGPTGCPPKTKNTKPSSSPSMTTSASTSSEMAERGARQEGEGRIS